VISTGVPDSFTGLPIRRPCPAGGGCGIASSCRGQHLRVLEHLLHVVDRAAGTSSRQSVISALRLAPSLVDQAIASTRLHRPGLVSKRSSSAHSGLPAFRELELAMFADRGMKYRRSTAE
jgi:hypothetical protein